MTYLEVIDREVRAYAKNGVKILELGTYNGATTKVLGNIAKELNGELHCVDMKFTNYFESAVYSNGLKSFVTTHEGKTQDVLPNLPEASFDVVYIDAGHVYSDVKNDLQACKWLLKEEGGFIIGDDLNSYIDWDGGDNMWKIFEEEKNKYGIKMENIPGTVYTGVFIALKEFAGETRFKFQREENLFWGVYPTLETYA